MPGLYPQVSGAGTVAKKNLYAPSANPTSYTGGNPLSGVLPIGAGGAAVGGGNPLAPRIGSSYTLPTGPAPAPSGGGGGGRGANGMPNFDYDYLLANDPTFKYLSGIYGAGGSQQTANQGQRKMGIDQALVADADPTYLASLRSGMYGDAIDQATIDAMGAANSSGVGGYARRQQAYQDAQTGWVNRLAANGILQSGETGYQLGREGLKFNQNEYDAKNALLSLLAGVQKDFLGAESSRQSQYAGGLMDAANRQMQLWLGLNAAGGSGSNDSSGNFQSGVPIPQPGSTGYGGISSPIAGGGGINPQYSAPVGSNPIFWFK